MTETIHGQQLEQATQLALSLARQYRGVDVTDHRGDYLAALEDFANLLAEFDDAIGVEPDPTPALGDDDLRDHITAAIREV